MSIQSTLDKDDNLNNPHKPAEPNTDHLNKTGLDEWNERLDNNLEGESAGDPQADDNAKSYSEHFNEAEPQEEKPTLVPPSAPRGAKDGLDNTGTQGYDSLSDDSFVGSSGKESEQDQQSHTGSSSSDFDDPKEIGK